MGTSNLPDTSHQGNALASHRHAVGSEKELRVWPGHDPAHGAFVELRLFRRPVESVSRDADAFAATQAGLRIPAHLVARIAADLAALAPEAP